MLEILIPEQLQTCRDIFPNAAFHLKAIDLELLNEHILSAEKRFVHSHLSPSEQERFFSFKYRKRQVEWLGGRVAAKKALRGLLAALNYTTPEMTDLSINSTPEGRPFLQSHLVTLPVDISISHSGNRATALAATKCLCGIDIQEITKTISKVKSRFITPPEEQSIRQLPCLRSFDEETPLALIWSAKEAFRKGVPNKPVLGFSEVTLREVTGTVSQGFLGIFDCNRPGVAGPLKVFFTLSGQFAIAITCTTLTPMLRNDGLKRSVVKP
nr:4'-phosphopantetheinyl transferase superfamily protein [Desulfobulbaceae bacterium]